jgi:hypothetical protein
MLLQPDCSPYMIGIEEAEGVVLLIRRTPMSNGRIR